MPDSEMEVRWRQILTDNPVARQRRRFHRSIPSSPRCKLCAAPFGLPGGPIMALLGHPRWPKNPKYCAGCFAMLERNHGGAEINCSLLFADVRGSTTMAERMSPREFNRIMGRFHDVAYDVLTDHDAFVDKFVGDEIIGIFVPALAAGEHACRAVESARELLRRTGHGGGQPWVPVGIGIGTGTAYVGSLGEGPDTDLTAMGDLVNTTARLASAAGGGEILVTLPAAAAADIEEGDERRALALKGKSRLTDVVVLRS